MKQIAWLFCCLILTTADAASFDCAKAQSKIEHMVCDTQRVSKIDDELGAIYQDVISKASTGEKDRVMVEQKYWLIHERNNCNDSICLERIYNERIKSLSNILRLQLQTRSQIVLSTYLGGKGDDRAKGIKVDRHGNIYIGGFTQYWDDFPTLNAIQDKRQGVYSGIVAKYSRDGMLEWATHLGGTKSNRPISSDAYNVVTGLAFDKEDNLYVAGDTDAIDFPVVNAAQPVSHGMDEAFLVQFDGNGKLIWSTYVGGYGVHYIRAISADSDGAVYLAAQSRQPNGLLGVLAKFDNSGKFVWKKEFGDIDLYATADSIAIDGVGNIYIGGATYTNPLPKEIENAGIAKEGWQSSYIAKFDKNGNLLWTTKLPSGLAGIDVEQIGNIYIVGSTNSKAFPILHASQPVLSGRGDAFAAKISTDGQLLWSTYLGGKGIDAARAVAVDVNGFVHVTGHTASTGFPIKNAFQYQKAGVVNAFITTYSPTGKLVRSSYLGGNGFDMAFSITADHGANVYVTGYAGSSDFPLMNPHQIASGGNNDIFITKIDALK